VSLEKQWKLVPKMLACHTPTCIKSIPPSHSVYKVKSQGFLDSMPLLFNSWSMHQHITYISFIEICELEWSQDLDVMVCVVH